MVLKNSGLMPLFLVATANRSGATYDPSLMLVVMVMVMVMRMVM